jgi:hypothetical protein
MLQVEWPCQVIWMPELDWEWLGLLMKGPLGTG